MLRDKYTHSAMLLQIKMLYGLNKYGVSLLLNLEKKDYESILKGKKNLSKEQMDRLFELFTELKGRIS